MDNYLLAGATFTSTVGPMGIFYLTLGFTVVIFIHFIAMNVASKFQDVAGSEVAPVKAK